MKCRLLAVAALMVAASDANAQGLWWVEGDRFCSDFNNRSRNSAMCGNPRRGETVPRPTFRYQFNTPRVPGLEDQPAPTQGIIPAPNARPGAGAPAGAPPRRPVQ